MIGPRGQDIGRDGRLAARDFPARQDTRIDSHRSTRSDDAMVPRRSIRPQPRVPSSRLPAARSRLVVLGASNVRMALPLILDEALRRMTRPTEVFVACGHGRSYGLESAIPGRVLPAITECGIWDALADRDDPLDPSDRLPSEATRIILADIGNDLMYGQTPESIITFVSTCLERLGATRGRAVIVGLPLCNTADHVLWKYQFLRTVLFPGLTLPATTFLARVEELDSRLRDLARHWGVAHLTPIREWYGFDPIHFRRHAWRNVWRAIVSQTDAPVSGPRDTPKAHGAIPQPPYPPLRPPSGAGLSVGQWLSVKRRPVASRRWLGLEQTATQPSMILPDGSPLSFF